MICEIHEANAESIIQQHPDFPENVFFFEFTGSISEIESELIEYRINTLNLPPKSVAVLDLSLFNYINSRFLGMIVKFHKNMEELSGKLVLIIPDPQVMKLLKITRCDHFLAISETREQCQKIVMDFIEKS